MCGSIKHEKERNRNVVQKTPNKFEVSAQEVLVEQSHSVAFT